MLLHLSDRFTMKSNHTLPEQVVLVNRSGRKTGLAEKMAAHENGWLHRAFSIFLFNEKGEMLLQQRAADKYHFGNLWTNACCSHPRPGEKIMVAASRRLKEELGIHSKLKVLDSIQYSFFDQKSNLTEHEYDFILAGSYDGPVPFNRKEVKAIKWVTTAELKSQLTRAPQKFTPWFKLIMQKKKLTRDLNTWKSSL